MQKGDEMILETTGKKGKTQNERTQSQKKKTKSLNSKLILRSDEIRAQ